MSTYREMLLDPRWQRTRLLVLQRDQWRCLHCGDTEATLHVHHTFYERDRAPWEYHPDSLVTLCASCHERITRDPDFVLRCVDGVRNQEEEAAFRAAIDELPLGRTAQEEPEALLAAIEAIRAARTMTALRVRQPYTPDFA